MRACTHASRLGRFRDVRSISIMVPPHVRSKSISNNFTGPFIGPRFNKINVSDFIIDHRLPNLAARLEVEARYFRIISLMNRLRRDEDCIHPTCDNVRGKSMKTNKSRREHGVCAHLTPIYRIFIVFFIFLFYIQVYKKILHSARRRYWLLNAFK